MFVQAARSCFRTLARRKMSERMHPEQLGFFERRMFADHLARYRFASRLVRGKRVLDIACVDGYGARILSRTAREVVAVDIERPRLGGRRPNLRFVCSDAIQFLQRTKQRYDVIVSFETVEHLRAYQRFLALLKHRLKAGGLLVLSTPNKRFSDLFFGGTFNPYHVKEFYTRELSQAIAQVFGATPELYRVRPIRKQRIVWSAIRSFLHREPSIQKSRHDMTGIGNMFVVRK